MKNTFLILFLTAVMTASACGPNGTTFENPFGTEPSTSTTSVGQTFLGGTDAVTMKFLENSPPREIFDSGQFKAVVLVENVGEATIPSDLLHLKLKGFYPDDFSTIDRDLESDISVELTGARRGPGGTRLQGGQTQVNFPKDSAKYFKYKKPLPGDHEFVFIAEACYPYKTTALSQICTKEDFIKNEGTVCNPSESRSVANSGAPIEVSSVTQDLAGQYSTIIEFTVRKVGDVQIFKGRSGADPCLSEFDNMDRIKVEFEGLPNPSNLNCPGLVDDTPNDGNNKPDTLILSNGGGTFSCIQNLDGASRVDSLKTFTITLSYHVKDSIQQNVKVKHLLTGGS